MRSAHCFLLTRPQACSLLSLGGHGGLLAYSMSDQCRLRVSKKRRANATNAYLRYFLPLKLYPLRYSVVRQQNKQTPTRDETAQTDHDSTFRSRTHGVLPRTRTRKLK